MNRENMDENSEVIDLREVAKHLWKKKNLFYIVWGVTFVISCFIIFPIPRTYQADVTVAPESSEAQGGSLSSIASSFGFNLGNTTTSDAFYPDIYPEVMASNEFIANLLKVNVETLDGTVKTDYFNYLASHQKSTFYMVSINWTKRQLRKLTEGDKSMYVGKGGGDEGFSTFLMSEHQQMIFEIVRNNVVCGVDKKTGIITINVTDQDPLVCASIADSARVHLQDFITRYRTNKARVDYEYYLKLTNEAKAEYEASMKAYAAYCDSHLNTILQTELSKRDELENDLSMKSTTYNTMNTQLVAAKAKIQECTPAFSLLQGPTVPIKPTGPKRMIFVAGMLFLATIGTIIYVFRKDILNHMLGTKQVKS